MNPHVLIEVAESITKEELIELIARFMLTDSQQLLKNTIKDSTDVEHVKHLTAVLGHPKAFAQETCDIAYQCYFDHFHLGSEVEKKIRDIAEEYVR